jgi:hypothetical protein
MLLSAALTRFQVDVADLAAVLRGSHEARYYGPFRNAINVGAAEYFDLRTGTSFIDLWNSWKTSGVALSMRLPSSEREWLTLLAP